MQHSKLPAPTDQTSADALAFGVDAIFYADVPAWWGRLTAPFALSWRRQAVAVVALPLGGFALGAIAAMGLLQ